MPALFFFGYLFLETIAFWAVAQWIGLGWTLVAFFATMLFGMTIASLEARRLMSSQVVKGPDGTLQVKNENAGKTAGNVGLTLVGGLLLSLPGFVTTVIGALLIFPPTRAIFRTMATVSMFRSIENMGVKVYNASPMSKNSTSYGNFGGTGQGAGFPRSDFPRATTDPQEDNMVIDEEEIKRWSEGLDPDDFGGKGGKS